MMLISLLTRMRLTTAGLLAASVPFSSHRKQMELLVGEKARVTRRHVAASTSPVETPARVSEKLHFDQRHRTLKRGN